ncbi:MAG: hypothetical protein NC218_01580 [Acetobacter sp.]|nr:hypothetical protein [Acetobacter sp.]
MENSEELLNECTDSNNLSELEKELETVFHSHRQHIASFMPFPDDLPELVFSLSYSTSYIRDNKLRMNIPPEQLFVFEDFDESLKSFEQAVLSQITDTESWENEAINKSMLQASLLSMLKTEEGARSIFGTLRKGSSTVIAVFLFAAVQGHPISTISLSASPIIRKQPSCTIFDGTSLFIN